MVISTVVLNVDLECDRCYKKIRRVLCRIQDKANIKTISYDEKNNAVMVSGPFDADKVCKKLCCKAGRIIKDMQVKGKENKGGKDAAGDKAKPAEKDGGGGKAEKKDAAGVQECGALGGGGGGAAAVDEGGDFSEQPLAVGEVVEDVERVDGVGELGDDDLLGTAGGAEGVGVVALPVLVRVPPADADHGRRERAAPLGVATERGGHVGRVVVPRGAGWEERAPQPGYPLRRPERRVAETLLGGGRRLAGEERLQRDEPGNAARRAGDDVVGDVAARAVARHEDGGGR
uniref:HMA domain-containing protein n=1 Tax=Oryza barthii TaxID=65489 RepID=A0A0D3GTC1_9ORYZ